MTIASISAAATSADARPKHRHHAQVSARVTCDARGCSDNPIAAQNARGLERPARQARETTVRRAHRPRLAAQGHVTCNTRGCSDNAPAARTPATGEEAFAYAPASTPARTHTRIADANGNGMIIGSRPSGCPHRFCGCEASLYVFGSIKPELNLAANWARKFPRTSPAPGMVAARSGHVMVLMSHVEGNNWMVHDGNSGGGRTREHVRSISGYAIVNPHASRFAAN
jgi:hypothetical protein